jgi:hypothetical protein
MCLANSPGFRRVTGLKQRNIRPAEADPVYSDLNKRNGRHVGI